jgi:hypothetical protein
MPLVRNTETYIPTANTSVRKSMLYGAAVKHPKKFASLSAANNRDFSEQTYALCIDCNYCANDWSTDWPTGWTESTGRSWIRRRQQNSSTHGWRTAWAVTSINSMQRRTYLTIVNTRIFIRQYIVCLRHISPLRPAALVLFMEQQLVNY